jgi:hypothetical protein
MPSPTANPAHSAAGLVEEGGASWVNLNIDDRTNN